MSRSGYSDDCNGWDLIRWRGAVASSIKGHRGQELLRQLAESMDAMPVKELIEGDLEINGQFCALGVVGKYRGIDIKDVDAGDTELVANKFNISNAMVKEIVFMNDEWGAYKETSSERWARMRRWVQENIKS